MLRPNGGNVEILKSVDTWFLILAVVLLGGWFVWSIRKLFGNLEKALQDLHDLIEKLFDKDADHEKRISLLEGRCNSLPHCDGGRRFYDPPERQQPGAGP